MGDGMDHRDTVNLREFFEEKLDALTRETKLRFDNLDKALTLAREDAKDKYEHLNALRNEVTTDRGLLVRIDACKQTHATVVNEFAGVKKEISLLREAKSQVEGRAVEKTETQSQSNWSTQLTVVAILSGLSLVIMVIHLFIVKG